MIVEELKEHLDKLLSDEIYLCIELGYITPSSVKGLLKTIEGVSLKKWRNFDTNGWDLDFWFTFGYNNAEFTFSGSWYYGGYKIYKNI